jgi:hypothetical protein
VTQRDRTVITVVVMIAAIVGAWLLFIAPKRSEANHLAAQITTEQRQLAIQDAAVTQGEAAERQYASSYTELARLGEAVPSDDDVPSLIYQIQSAAQASRIDFRSLALSGSSSSSSSSAGSTATLPPGVNEDVSGLPEEPFTFTFNGSFFHLANFLGRLQRFVTATNDRISVSGRLMTLNSVTFAAGPSGFPEIAATIDATTYLVPGATLGVASPSPSSSPSSGSSTTANVSTSGSSSSASVTPSATVTASVR